MSTRRRFARCVSRSSPFAPGDRSRPCRPSFEFLERRELLSGDSSIVVGRTLSSYFVGGVANNQETITFTAYNEQANPETGVLLTDALAPGVTLISSTTPADRNGQNLAISLGTIAGYDRASVTITLGLPTPTPTQLDSGAKVFATLDAAAVTNTTPAATLRAGNVSDPSLLASTPDANTTDPFLQEQAAKLSYDPQQIFAYLHDDIGYNSYVGSLRGARGTIWSAAGNALDVASLGVALMRGSGIPAQYVSGTLTQPQASALILSMFPPSTETVGYVPPGTPTADPANDPQLLSETEQHDWFQFDNGGGFQDADPLMAGATVGMSFATATGKFAEVPDTLREKTQLQLNAEIYSQAGALFGFGPSTTTVLDQTFNDVDLVGRPISVGNLVNSTGLGVIFTTVTNTYSPYFELGDDATPDPRQDQIIQGVPFQDIRSTFPLASQTVTGLTLTMTLRGPQGPDEIETRTLLDRLGAAARHGGAVPNLQINPSSPPAISNFDIATIDVVPGIYSPSALAIEASALQDLNSQRAALGKLLDPNGGAQSAAFLQQAIPTVRAFLVAVERVLNADYATLSDLNTSRLGIAALVKAYEDRPRLLIGSSHLSAAGNAASLDLQLDLRRDTLKIVPYPGQNLAARFGFLLARGVTDNTLEEKVLTDVNGTAQASTTVNTATIFQAARSQGIAFVALTTENISILDTLAIPADAKALIADALQRNQTVVVPASSPEVNGVPTVGWYEIDAKSGDTVGVLQDGTHGSLASSVAILTVVLFFSSALTSYEAGYYTGLLVVPIGTVASFIAAIAEIRTTGTYTGAFRTLAFGLVDDVLLPLVGLINPRFVQGFEDGIRPWLQLLEGLVPPLDRLSDPPLSNGLLANLRVPGLSDPNVSGAGVKSASSLLPGALVAGGRVTASASIIGDLKAFWSTPISTSSGFQIRNLDVPIGRVTMANGAAVGAGSLTLNLSAPTPVSITGAASYGVQGHGDLAFYGPSATSLGVGASWDSYAASVGGSVTIAITTDGLVLNGTPLPAGTYLISTSAATLGGSGRSTSPDFSETALIQASNAILNIGQGSGDVSIGGQALEPSRGATFAGFSGNVGISEGGGGYDNVSFSGSAANAIQVSIPLAMLNTDENTSVSFKPAINATLSDSYAITAIAPEGWTVSVAADGTVTATPAPGLQGGTYPIQIIAKSETVPDLVAQSVVDVIVNPTGTGLNFNVSPDPLLTVPYNGAQLPTAFRATIRNTGPLADTFNLSLANIPSGFSLAESGISVSVPAGQVGILGLYLFPNPGQSIPPVGTVVTFNVTATSTTNPAITKTQAVSFTIPAIDGLTVTADQPSLTSTSGVAVSTTVRLTAVGNVAETVTPSITLPPGVTAVGLNSVTIQPGQTVTQTLTLTADSTVALNSPVSVTFTESFGPGSATLTSSATVSLVVRSAQVLAVQQAAGALAKVAGSQIGSNLSELADALAQLQGSPTNAVLLNRVQFLLGNLSTLLQSDPALASFANGLQPLQAAANSGDVNGLLSQTTAFFNGLTPVLTQEADQQFGATLSPAEVDLAPGQGKTFNLQLTSLSNDPIALTLAVANLPSGVTATPGQTQVTLAPGQTLTVPIMLSQTVQSTSIFTLGVTASASLVRNSATAIVAIRPAAADVLSVTTTPGTVNPGTPVAITAQVFNTANAARSLLAHVDLLDGSGNVLKSVSDTPVSLVPGLGPMTVNLPAIDSTGLGVGVNYARVILKGSDGGAIPGHTAQASFLVGIAVSASITASTAIVPPGTSSVTTTISVTGDNTVGSPGGSAGNSIELYYTRYGGNPSVQKVQVTYDGSSLNVATPVTVTQNVSADGAIFLPDGRLVVALGAVSFINPLTGTFTSIGGFEAEHLALDPSGTKIWTSPQPGSLIEIPLTSSPTEILHAIKGDDTIVTQLAFDTQGNAYYTTGFQNGFGNVGTIDLTTFTTKRFLSNLPGAHGIIFDPFTGDLFIANINHITQIDPTTMKVVSDFVDPNGSAFDQGSVDGKGHIYVADAGNGHLEFVDYSKTKLVGDPSNFHAAPFVTSTLDDVAPLVGLGSLGILTDVNEGLPATGFTVDAKTISPTPSSSSATNVEWFGNIALTDTSAHQFQLTGSVANMAPGEVREISTGSTVIAQATVASGQQLTNTINLPPVFVAANHIISIDPASRTIDRGATASYTVTLTNPLATAETYTLSTGGLGAFTTGLATSVIVAPGQTVQVPLTVAVPSNGAVGLTAFTVSAQTLEGGTDSVEGQLTVLPTVALATQAVVVSLNPTQTVAGPGMPVTFQVVVTNTGDATTTYSLAGTFPAGFVSSFSQPTVTVPPGLGNSRTVTLRLTPPATAAAGPAAFSVMATSTTSPVVTAAANGSIMVVPIAVSVAITPGTTTPGSPLQLLVTNTGQVAGTFNLALGGPAALVSTLSTAAVTLAPGASQSVAISTSAVNFAVPGALPLVGIATSAANPSIVAGAMANLTIAAISGFTAQVTPSTQTLAQPGLATFRVDVNNTGNVEDSYVATIVGTTGPVTATLIGLDGLPTQTIPLFRLPGLSSGVITLQANLTATGIGTVTIVVKSLTHGTLVATTVATVQATATTGGGGGTGGGGTGGGGTGGGGTTPTDGPQVLSLRRFGYHEMPTTLVVAFNGPLNQATAQDVANYVIVDPHGHRVAVTSAVYNAATNSVTLHTARRLNIHRAYRLTIRGIGSTGLTGSTGLLLDGARTGRPGSDYLSTIDRSKLVIGAVTPAGLHLRASTHHHHGHPNRR